jgi:hypothetical protein
MVNNGAISDKLRVMAFPYSFDAEFSHKFDSQLTFSLVDRAGIVEELLVMPANERVRARYPKKALRTNRAGDMRYLFVKVSH